MPLTENQRVRYARNLRIPGFGESGQQRLSGARVLIVGLGGLGSPAAFYLAAAGVGTLGLLDSDYVELSNLQRQILHTTPRLDQSKIVSAAKTLEALNPDVRLETFQARLTPANAAQWIGNYDAVVEACDNFDAKFLINDVCLDLKKPFATAGILAMSGQAQFVVPGHTACLRCTMPAVPEGVPTTQELGVLGAVPGILGSVEAMEVIRWLTGFWRPQADGAGWLHSVDGETMRLRTMRVPRGTDCPCGRLWNAG
jgi:molybdopterin-synthase adenylyltransferase